MFKIDETREESLKARIKVMGIGGGGSNAVNHMERKNLKGALTIAANTDLQALHASLASIKIQLGKNLTGGLGAGGDPEVGRLAMEESREEVREALRDCDVVFLTAGMGGGTGTGGIPVAAEISREMGALTVAIVTKPFKFEGRPRMEKAEAGLKKLRDKTDTLIVIPNERLLEIYGEKPLKEAFAIADEILYQSVKGIIDIIKKPGYINVDFADIREMMKKGGEALMGSGEASGEDRVREATFKALNSPLLDGATIRGAKGIVVNVVGDESLRVTEVDAAVKYVLEEASKNGGEPELIFGYVIDPSMEGLVRVTVIATGIKRESSKLEEDEEIVVKEEEKAIPAYLRKEKKKPSYLRWKDEDWNQ